MHMLNMIFDGIKRAHRHGLLTFSIVCEDLHLDRFVEGSLCALDQFLLLLFEFIPKGVGQYLSVGFFLIPAYIILSDKLFKMTGRFFFTQHSCYIGFPQSGIRVFFLDLFNYIRHDPVTQFLVTIRLFHNSGEK